jgi:hypothetical protein
MAKAERHLPLCSNTARLAAYLAFLVHEIEKRRGSLRITQSTMVVFKVDTVSFAEISQGNRPLVFGSEGFRRLNTFKGHSDKRQL